MIGKIFGTDKSIKKQIAFIKGLNIEDELKSSMISKIFGYYTPFKLLQRIIALIFTLIFVIAIIIALVANGMGHDVKDVIAIITAFNLGMIILAILGFYFSGGAVESFKGD
jgi:uncharacterized membrane protein YbhN (UPF0104 family)